jgi:epoxyqueuosine reductase
MTQTAERLTYMIEERGWKGRIVSIDHLDDLERAIRDRYECGLLDERLYREQLSWFSFELPKDLPDVRSIIIVALPVPQTRTIFHWKGTRLAVIVPPTYVGYSTTTARVQAVLASWLERENYRVSAPRLPLKTLAVSGGLAEYGRNNICYVAGMGSFLQLVGAFSDLPCSGDLWREPRMLQQCESCVACLRCCPSGAIAQDRFLLRAEYCLTYHNEGAGEFPAWIDQSWHHCLVGCMKCQSLCPENKAVAKWFDDRVEFSEHETACLVERVPFSRLPGEAAAKLRSLEINEDYQNLCRNLSMLVNQANCAA